MLRAWTMTMVMQRVDHLRIIMVRILTQATVDLQLMVAHKLTAPLQRMALQIIKTKTVITNLHRMTHVVLASITMLDLLINMAMATTTVAMPRTAVTHLPVKTKELLLVLIKITVDLSKATRIKDHLPTILMARVTIILIPRRV